ncbi:MAG: leucine-rich repeat protein [Ruminococcus sp.]|nr:leucine-rich repeat protein [Ruminococcus sp.]
MTHYNRVLSLTTAFLITILLTVTGSISPYAESTFTQGDFEYVISGQNEVMLYKYLGSGSALSLPKTISGMSVTGIYSGCFRDSQVESVTIPDTYTAIESDAFYNCTALNEITLPKKLTMLGNAAFQNCSALSRFDASKSVLLTSLPDYALSGTISLNTVLFPSGLLEIGKYVFSNSGISEIIIPANVEKVSTGAFRNCSGLTKVKLSSQMNSVSANCFSGCSSLSSVTIPNSVDTIGDNAFYGCTSLERIDLPSSIYDFGKFAFYGCTSLREIDLPNFTTTIGEGCFQNDTAIKKLFIPPTVVNIGANCFAPMSYGKTIEVTCFNDTYAYEYCYDNFVVNLKGIDYRDGDFSLDGSLNISDVTAIQKYIAGLRDIEFRQSLKIGDVNGDGEISVRDATLIQMRIADIITHF